MKKFARLIPSFQFFFLLALTMLLGSCANQVPATDMSEPQHVHHQINYIEISVTDMAAAQKFYAAAFGWQFTDYGPEYAGIKKQVGEAGGLRLMDKVTTGGPLVILYSDDIVASFEQANSAGARITAEVFEFPGGRRFQFLDPSGNELAVWGN
jgi:hypothetical protein